MDHCNTERDINYPSSVLWLREGGFRQDHPVHDQRHWPLNPMKASYTLSRETAPKRMFPPLCLIVGMIFAGLYSAYLPLQAVELMPLGSIFVQSDHIPFSQASLNLLHVHWQIHNVLSFAGKPCRYCRISIHYSIVDMKL